MMVYKTILLALSIIITINSTYGYMDEYGMGYERRGEVGKEELEAKLYKQLEDNYGQVIHMFMIVIEIIHFN